MERRPYSTWTVDGQEHKLKLTAEAICNAEAKIGTNLLNIFENGLPPLKNTLIVLHESAQKYDHGITLGAVYDMFDKYVEEGGTQTKLFNEVIVPLFTVSGFFTIEESEKIEEAMKESL